MLATWFTLKDVILSFICTLALFVWRQSISPFKMRKNKKRSKNSSITNAKFHVNEVVFCYFARIIYEAVCREIFVNSKKQRLYLVHYMNWDESWDEWVHENVLLKHESINYPFYEKYFKFFYGEWVFILNKGEIVQGKVIKLMHDTCNKCRYLVKIYNGLNDIVWSIDENIFKFTNENKKTFEKYLKFYHNERIFCYKNCQYRPAKCLFSQRINNNGLVYQVKYLNYDWHFDKFSKFEWLPECLLHKRDGTIPCTFEVDKCKCSIV